MIKVIYKGMWSRNKFCLVHIGAKIATLEAHPIIDHGTKEEFKTFVSKAVVPGFKKLLLDD